MRGVMEIKNRQIQIQNIVFWSGVVFLSVMAIFMYWRMDVSAKEEQKVKDNIEIVRQQKRENEQIISRYEDDLADLKFQKEVNSSDRIDQELLDIINGVAKIKLANEQLQTQFDELQKEVETQQKEYNTLQKKLDKLELELQERKEAEEKEQKTLALDAYYDLKRFKNRDDSKIVYLTFDDGPSYMTPKILDILDRYQVKATFFVKYTEYKDFVPYYKEIVNGGHAIGVHTASHDYNKIYGSLDDFMADFDKIYNWIYQHTGVYTTLYRFPGGSLNAQKRGILSEAKSFLRERGVMYYDWNVENGDGGTVTAEEAYFKVIDNIREKSHPIILMHDMKNVTVEALPSIIEQLLEWGYTFEPLTSDVKPVWQSS